MTTEKEESLKPISFATPHATTMLALAAMKRTSMLARHMTAAAGNPKVFFDIEIDQKETGRIVMEVML